MPATQAQRAADRIRTGGVSTAGRELLALTLETIERCLANDTTPVPSEIRRVFLDAVAELGWAR